MNKCFIVLKSFLNTEMSTSVEFNVLLNDLCCKVKLKFSQWLLNSVLTVPYNSV